MQEYLNLHDFMKEVAESFSSPEVGKRHKGGLKNLIFEDKYVEKDTTSVFLLLLMLFSCS